MSEDIPPQVRQQVERIQQVQERLQFVHTALHQIKQQLAEINLAQKQLADLTDETVIYQMAGSLLFKTTKDKATKTLDEQAEALTVRQKSLEKHTPWYIRIISRKISYYSSIIPTTTR